MERVSLPDDGDVTVLRRGHGVSAWRQIADHLRGDILSGVLPGGAQLSTEAMLAERFGVNRHTVRRALAVLAADGLVRTTQGRGTFVEARPLPYPIGPRTRFSEIVARGGRDPGGVVLAAETGQADAAIAAALGIELRAPVLTLVTLRSADGAPISYAHSHHPLPRFEGLEELRETGMTLSDALARYGVGDYRRTVTRITARPASAEEAARLELAPGRVILVVESVNVDGEGTPIQATTSRFAADRVEIVVES